MGTAALRSGLLHSHHLHPNWPMGHHPADADHVRYGRASEAGGFQTRPVAPGAGRCGDLSPLSGDAARRLAAGAAVSYAAGAFRRDGAGRQRRQRDRLQRDDLSCQRGCGAVGNHLLGLHPRRRRGDTAAHPSVRRRAYSGRTSWACCSAFCRLWSSPSRWD
ncbi:Uncharacterised protein [Klebsiella pneumoniae]|uniref:Uncharacterized protein n=1 Tax=Klebsiella pneumoniae TaxID=573 RepID=A0A377TK72_KLEPN|nr:Uncharacterised protein [Klebsiella pneumoniae]